MKVACHQPELWPIPRLLAKWRQADLLILLDIVQFDRESLQHRCKLRSVDGTVRPLTIPFRHEIPFPQIRAVEAADPAWMQHHWARVRQWYGRVAAPDRLALIGDWFQDAGRYAHEGIAFHAARSMVLAAEWARVSTPVIWASAMLPPPGGWGSKNDLLVNLCKAVRAKTFLSGRSGAKYLDYALFERMGIGIEVQAFPPAGEELSSLHVFLTEGPEALAQQVRA